MFLIYFNTRRDEPRVPLNGKAGKGQPDGVALFYSGKALP